MVGFELQGLNSRQQVLADIMWSLEEYSDVEAFIETLPAREAAECRSIIEMMRWAVVEQCYDGLENTQAADQVVDRIRKL